MIKLIQKAVFICLVLLTSDVLKAATITVNDSNGGFIDNGLCSLTEAILNANRDNDSYDDCAAGSGTDTIELNVDVTLTAVYQGNDSLYGHTGSPTITDPLIIDGQGHTIERDAGLSCDINSASDPDEFRLLQYSNPNVFNAFTIKNITLKNGCADFEYVEGDDRKRYGGAVLAFVNLVVENTTFVNNHSTRFGGALVASYIQSLSTSTFVDNSAGYGGGAVAVVYSADNIINNTFSENHGANFGGAIYGNIDSEVDDIKNNTFFSNTSNRGGAIAVMHSADNIMNNTFSENNGVFFGGAIYGNSDSEIDNIKNNTFFSNTSKRGGALYSDGTITELNNNLFYFNVASNLNSFHDCEVSVDSPVITGVSNISNWAAVGSNCPGLITQTLNHEDLLPLADNGGPTMTHQLIVDSAAINMSVNGVSSDQRGLFAYGVRDIGAYETQDYEFCDGIHVTDGFSVNVTSEPELKEAVLCSNHNGDELDTISILADIPLFTPYELALNMGGENSTAIITTPLHVVGNNSTLFRAFPCNINGIHEASEFRFFQNGPNNELTLENITLSNGCADGGGSQGSGGAVYNEGELILSEVSFLANKSNRSGGAIYQEGAMSEVNLSQFTDNISVNDGGAISSQSSILNIAQSTFMGNTSTSSSGGAISSNGLIQYIEASTFANNSAAGLGGGLFNAGQLLSLDNSTFSGNTAGTNGGGISNLGLISGIENNTFSGNTADGSGGAIYGFNGGQIVDLNNSLFHNNNSDCATFNAGISGSNNMSDKTSQNSACPALVNTLLNSSTIGPLGNYGGSTPSHALLAGSEALNAAVDGLTTDQRGFNVQDGARDMGAIEDQIPVVTAPPAAVFEATGPNTQISANMLGEPTVYDPDQVGLVASTLESLPNDYALGDFQVTWRATDNHGRSQDAIQLFSVVDTTVPVITLNGDAVVVLDVDDDYVDAGATATDVVSGNLTGDINTSNPVNTAVAGVYTITYDVQDGASNQADQVSRSVEVKAAIGGTVSGLINGSTVLISDGTEDLELGNGAYTFTNRLSGGANYSVSIVQQPSGTDPFQICEVSNATGTINAGNIDDINVTCAAAYLVGGMVNGLANGNEATLSMATQSLLVNNNGAFVFDLPLTSGSTYVLSVSNQPTEPNQTCDVLNATGNINGSDVIDVMVNCNTNTYTIGGSITGLHAGNNLELINNGTDTLFVSDSGIFDFITEIEDLQSYVVSIESQPTDPIQTCTITSNTEAGQVNGEDVITVEVNCEPGDDFIYNNGFEYLP